MPNTVRIKRRVSGTLGAPPNLANAELAFNEVGDGVLYYGKGLGSNSNAAIVIPIGGSGAFVNLSETQTISGAKTFSSIVSFTNSLVTAVTQGSSDNSTKLATTEFVKNQNYLTGNQSVTLSGDATGTGTTSIYVTLANVGVSGTYTKVSTDSKGRVTSGTTLSASDIPNLTANKITDFDTQVRTNRLDQLAHPTSAVSLNNNRLTNLSDPANPQDAATKAYVDAIRSGLDVKTSVRAASTANLSITYTATAGVSTRGQITDAPSILDGVTLVNGNRILLKNQDIAAQNGIWVVTSAGSGSDGVWDRATDFDQDVNVTSGAFTFVEEGTVNADSGWVLTTDGVITIGGSSGTSLVFAQYSGAGQILAGDGMTKSGNTLNIVTANSGRIVVNADNIDLASGIVTPGTYQSVTVDTYGRIIAGGNPTTLSGYGITDAQPLDATLTALAGVTVAANQLIYSTAADTFTVTNLTSFGRSLIDDSDASTARTTLGLGTIATQNADNVNITGGSIDNIIFDCGTF
jgi:hypothetical protein